MHAVPCHTVNNLSDPAAWVRLHFSTTQVYIGTGQPVREHGVIKQWEFPSFQRCQDCDCSNALLQSRNCKTGWKLKTQAWYNPTVQCVHISCQKWKCWEKEHNVPYYLPIITIHECLSTGRPPYSYHLKLWHNLFELCVVVGSPTPFHVKENPNIDLQNED